MSAGVRLTPPAIAFLVASIVLVYLGSRHSHHLAEEADRARGDAAAAQACEARRTDGEKFAECSRQYKAWAQCRSRIGNGEHVAPITCELEFSFR
jgi:hypothetical protein